MKTAGCALCRGIDQRITTLLEAVATLHATIDERVQQQTLRRLHVAPPMPAKSGEPSQAVVIGGQRLSRNDLQDLQRDAARYRWLRDQADSMHCTAAPMVASLDEAGRVVDFLDGEDLDAAVDKMLTPAARRRAPKTKRMGTNR
jgi:hypothetical protein